MEWVSSWVSEWGKCRVTIWMLCTNASGKVIAHLAWCFGNQIYIANWLSGELWLQRPRQTMSTARKLLVDYTTKNRPTRWQKVYMAARSEGEKTSNVESPLTVLCVDFEWVVDLAGTGRFADIGLLFCCFFSWHMFGQWSQWQGDILVPSFISGASVHLKAVSFITARGHSLPTMVSVSSLASKVPSIATVDGLLGWSTFPLPLSTINGRKLKGISERLPSTRMNSTAVQLARFSLPQPYS